MQYCFVMNTALNPAERVRERMRRWMETANLDQRTFAGDLKKSQVWLQKVLTGENQVRLRDLDQIADAMRTTTTELVRSDEERYTLELTPTEVRIVEALRRLRADVLDAFLKLLDARPTSDREKPLRRPTKTSRPEPV